MDPIKLLQHTADFTLFPYLREVWGDAPWVDVVLNIMGVVFLSTFCLLIIIFLIWLERKVIARMQDRIGPNRVGGKYGLLQPVADALKLLTKEAISPDGADKLAYNIAPFLTVAAALLVWAVLPFGPSLIGVDLNIGLFYILAVSSASVVSLLLAGWGSNNKYALLGAFRAVAQMVSYEVPMILSLLIPILIARSMSTMDIIEAQNVPFLFVIPVSAVIFLISALAETGRTPFDLLEAESEIVAGFHVEYTGMKFSMFMAAEFIGALFMCGLFAVVYMGGFRFFGLETLVIGEFALGNVIGLLAFFIKMFMVYFIFMWVRATWPRVRVDQMLNFNWKFLVPISIVLIFAVAILEKVMDSLALTNDYARAGVHLAMNLLIGGVALELARRRNRQERENFEATMSARAASNMAHATAAAD